MKPHMFQRTNDRETMPASRLVTRRAHAGFASSPEIPVEVARGSSRTRCQPGEPTKGSAFEPGEQPSESVERRSRHEPLRPEFARLSAESKRDVPEPPSDRKPI